MLENPHLLLLVIPILLFSIVIHEMAHGYAALFLGDPTAKNMGRLTLNPLVHLDPLWSVLVPTTTMLLGGFFFGMAKPVVYNPRNLRDKKWGEAKIALAGPVSNMVIALIFVSFIKTFALFGLGSPVLYDALAIVVIMNIFLAVFNLIPIAPLDGSKILFALLKPNQQYIRIWMEQNSFFLLLILLVVLLNTPFLSGFVWWLSSILI